MSPQMERAIIGVPEFDRPEVDISASDTCWQIMTQVSSTLKRKGMNDDPGMLFTLALVFVTIPGQEPV